MACDCLVVLKWRFFSPHGLPSSSTHPHVIEPLAASPAAPPLHLGSACPASTCSLGPIYMLAAPNPAPTTLDLFLTSFPAFLCRGLTFPEASQPRAVNAAAAAVIRQASKRANERTSERANEPARECQVVTPLNCSLMRHYPECKCHN